LSGRSHESLNDALEKAVATAPHTNRDHMLVLETYSSRRLSFATLMGPPKTTLMGPLQTAQKVT